MRVGIVHSFYRSESPSGENRAVQLEVHALQERGHHVSLAGPETDLLETNRTYPIRAAGNLLQLGDVEKWAHQLALANVDVIHVHNLFPNIPTRVVKRLVDIAPVVATMHNYRPFCAAGTFSRSEKTDCRDCVTRSRLSAIRHRCYHDSVLATTPVALTRRFTNDPVVRYASALVVLTEAMRDTYEELGVAVDRMSIIPNFVEDHGANATPAARHGYLYAGRLTNEKGVIDLVKNWPDDVPLTIAGSGPAHAKVSQAARKNVQVLGAVDHDQVISLMASAEGLIFPSKWREGLPLTVLEALSTGTPVICDAANNVASLVEQHEVGKIVVDNNWSSGCDSSVEELAKMGAAARSLYESTYSPTASLTALLGLFEQVTTKSFNEKGK